MSRRTFRALLFLSGALPSAVAWAGVGVWTTNGPGNVKAARVVADARVPGALYVGTSNGVEKSLDGGHTWSQTTLLSGEPLAASDGVVYASVVIPQGPPVLGGFYNVIYKSLDAGVHWQTLVETTTLVSIWIDPMVPSTLYRSDSTGLAPPYHYPHFAGLFRSNDGGVNWTKIDNGLGGDLITAFVADPQSASLYVGSIGALNAPGLYKSTDGGATWTLLSSEFSTSSLAMDPHVTATVYAAGSGIFVSTNGGASFSQLGAPPGFVSALVLDPAVPARLYATMSEAQTGVYGSDDGGASWWPMNQGLPGAPPSVGGLALDASGSVLYTTSNGNVWDFEIDPGSLVLNSAHPFTITLTATDPRSGHLATGLANKVNDLWGYFSLPAITGNPNNPEVFVKMLDGTALNGAYWFFYGGLTDLEYTLTVTDSATGKQKTYSKPAGSECGGSDTAAFSP